MGTVEGCLQADEEQRPEAVQALLADPYAAEDVVRSAAWPSFCASIDALLSGPQPATASAGVTFLERVLEEARLSDPQSVAELFIALASHLCSTTASYSRLPTAESIATSALLPAVKAVPAVPRLGSGLSSRQDETADLSGPDTFVPSKACGGSNLSAAVIAVDCRAGKGHLQSAAIGEHGSTPQIAAASQNGTSHLPQQSLHAQGATAQEHAAADQQQTPKTLQQGSLYADGMASQHSSPSSLDQMGDARARQFRLLGKMLEALPKLWVCLKPPMMRKLWRSLSALLLVEPRCDSMPAAHAAGTAQTEQQDRQQSTIELAGLESSMHGNAGDLHPSAPGACPASMRGPLVELSLALEPAPLHAKSWWQAWTLPISSTRVRCTTQP